MKKTLNIDVSVIPGHGVVATDITDYSSIGIDIQEHVMIDFLSYEGDAGVYASSVSEWPFGQTPYAELPLQYDGLLYYYKLAVPKSDHFIENKTSSNVIYRGIENQLYMHDGTLYFCNSTSENLDNISNILGNSIVITNYIDAYELVLANEGSQTFYFPRLKVLIYLKLQDCLVKLQKKLLLGAGNTCSLGGSLGCSADQNLKGQVDFLLTAVYILEYLKNIGNFEEAMRILENIVSCPDICGSDITLKGCGCGKTI